MIATTTEPATEQEATLTPTVSAAACAVANGWIISAEETVINGRTLREWCAATRLQLRRASKGKGSNEWRMTIPGIGSWRTSSTIAQQLRIWSREARGLPPEPEEQPYQLNMWHATQAPLF